MSAPSDDRRDDTERGPDVSEDRRRASGVTAAVSAHGGGGSWEADQADQQRRAGSGRDEVTTAGPASPSTASPGAGSPGTAGGEQGPGEPAGAAEAGSGDGAPGPRRGERAGTAEGDTASAEPSQGSALSERVAPAPRARP